MDIKRRDFVNGCAAVCVLLLLGIASAAKGENAKGENAKKAPASAADLRIEKSIKASFGGGFSVLTHTQSGGLTRANIEHAGNRYAVTSANQLDWKIVRSSLSN